MPTPVLEGYLTEARAKCYFLGDVHKDLGCCAPFPIMDCHAFEKMYNEEEAKARKENEK